MTTLLEEAPAPIQRFDFPPLTPSPPDKRPTDQPYDPTRCGVCGEDKIKLPQTTKRQGLPIYVCTNIKEDADMPCDGYAYKNAVFNFSDYAGV